MIGRIINLMVVAGLLLGSIQLDAHEEFRIEGAVVKFEDRSLVVKSRTGESFTIRLQKSTVVRRERERVPQTELQPGRTVTVRIMADSLYDENPFVLSVSLMPANARRTAK